MGHMSAQAAERERAHVEIINNGGDVIGHAELTQGSIGTLLYLEAENLPPGPHGFHVHSVGTCDAHDHFKSASGHVGLKEGGHGYLNPEGPEKGDLPNLIVHEDGSAALELFLPQLDIADMLDEDGSSLMIHENPDDHMTQPIGGAGGRIACGVIEGVEKTKHSNKGEK